MCIWSLPHLFIQTVTVRNLLFIKTKVNSIFYNKATLFINIKQGGICGSVVEALVKIQSFDTSACILTQFSILEIVVINNLLPTSGSSYMENCSYVS